MKLIHGSALTVKIPPFDHVVTSPPYYKLRKYGGKGELGWERSEQEYIDNLVQVFTRLWEQQPAEGTLWINIGDKHDKGRLMGLPWRLVVALMPFYTLHSDNIWHKRRIMPQSAKTRFTCDHEYVFFLSKSPKEYTFNHEAVMQKSLWAHDRRAGKGAHRYRQKRERDGLGHTAPVVINEKRLCRTVWNDISTNQEDKNHSATFPVAIPERCILAGSNPGDTILDPFCGTCTTGVAAEKHGRKFIGIDTNKDFFQAIQ